MRASGESSQRRRSWAMGFLRPRKRRVKWCKTLSAKNWRQDIKRILALLVLGALTTFTLSLVNPPQASADLKSVLTAICRADDNTIVRAFGPNPSGPSTGCASLGQDCGGFMVCMDDAKWHVIHDTRYGGAWYQNTSAGVCGAGAACFELIFQKD